MSPPKPTKNQQKVLNQFLRRHKANSALSLTETKGFLFMVACCPEMVIPSEWQSLVISEDVIFESKNAGLPPTNFNARPYLFRCFALIGDPH